MNVQAIVALLGLFAGKAGKIYGAVLESVDSVLNGDQGLHSLSPGATTTLALPADTPAIPSRSGKEFLVVGVIVKRVDHPAPAPAPAAPAAPRPAV